MSPQVADAFVAGLHRAFYLMGGILVTGAIISFLRGERKQESPAPGRQAGVVSNAPESRDS